MVRPPAKVCLMEKARSAGDLVRMLAPRPVFFEYGPQNQGIREQPDQVMKGLVFKRVLGWECRINTVPRLDQKRQGEIQDFVIAAGCANQMEHTQNI